MWAHDPCLVGDHDRLDPVAQPKLHHDPGYMGLDGVLQHEQGRRYLGVGLAAGEQLQDLVLAVCESAQVVDALLRAPGELLDEVSGDRRREHRPPVSDYPDSGGKPFLRSVLEQEPTGPGPQCLVHDLVEIECGQHEHPGGVLGPR